MPAGASTPPTPASTSTAGALASDLKEQGNKAFASGDYLTAVVLYTSAVDLATSNIAELVNSDDLAALYSNRCAAYIHLFEYDLALLDADKAVALRPEWSRAWARRGECYSGLGDLETAAAQYEKAITLAEDPSAANQFSLSLKTLSSRRSALLAGPINFRQRIADLEEEGKVEFVVGGTAELVHSAWGWVEEAMVQIDKDVWKEEESFGSKVPSGILGLADGLLAHPLAFHIPPGRDPGLPLGEKLPLQYQYDIQVFGNERYLIGDLSCAEIIEEFEVRANSEGWTKVRTALAHLIRGQVLMAFVEEATGAYASSVKKYRFAVALIEEGLKRWSRISEADKGTTFTRTFKRAVQVALMSALEEGWSNAKSTEEKAAFGLEEIQAHAEELMDDCVTHPATHDPGNPTYWLQSQIIPLVHAAKAIAFVLVHRSQLLENITADTFDQATYFHPKMNAAASKMYTQAAFYLPLDDPDRSICYYLALSCSLRAGGLTISEVFSKVAEAEAATPASEPVFGPVPRNYAVRNFVRKVCDELRSLLQLDQGAPTLQAVLKPIGRIAQDRLPDGRTAVATLAEGGVGEVQVWEVV